MPTFCRCVISAFVGPHVACSRKSTALSAEEGACPGSRRPTPLTRNTAGSPSSHSHLIDEGVKQIVGWHIREPLRRRRRRIKDPNAAHNESSHLASGDEIIWTIVAPTATYRNSERRQSVDKRVESIVWKNIVKTLRRRSGRIELPK